MPRFIRINGFTYMRGDFDMTTPFAARASVATRDELRLWRTKWLPEVKAVVAYLATFDASAVRPGEWAATIAEQANEFRRVFLPIHLYAVGYAEVTARAFVTAYQDKFAGSAEDGSSLLQGFPNASLDRAALVWELSRTLRANPESSPRRLRRTARCRTARLRGS